MCLKAIVDSLKKLKEEDEKGEETDQEEKMVNGDTEATGIGTAMDIDADGVRQKLVDRIGELTANKLFDLHDEKLLKILVQSPVIKP